MCIRDRGETTENSSAIFWVYVSVRVGTHISLTMVRGQIVLLYTLVIDSVVHFDFTLVHADILEAHRMTMLV